MPRYVALLRSVNVAGHGRIAMNELRASFEALGYTGVTTYIQTGNVLFSTGSKSEAGIASAIDSDWPRTSATRRPSSSAPSPSCCASARPPPTPRRAPTRRGTT